MKLVGIPDIRLWLEETNHNSQSSWEPDEFILPSNLTGGGRGGGGEDGICRLPDRVPLGLWLCGGHGMSTSLPWEKPFQTRNSLVYNWSTASCKNSVCPLVQRTEVVGSQVSHFPAVGYILTREASNAIAAWVSYHASGFAQYIQSFSWTRGVGRWQGTEWDFWEGESWLRKSFQLAYERWENGTFT